MGEAEAGLLDLGDGLRFCALATVVVFAVSKIVLQRHHVPADVQPLVVKRYASGFDARRFAFGVVCVEVRSELGLAATPPAIAATHGDKGYVGGILLLLLDFVRLMLSLRGVAATAIPILGGLFLFFLFLVVVA